jgi:alpha-tubulin suppressor-like RCC1 family protein
LAESCFRQLANALEGIMSFLARASCTLQLIGLRLSGNRLAVSLIVLSRLFTMPSLEARSGTALFLGRRPSLTSPFAGMVFCLLGALSASSIAANPMVAGGGEHSLALKSDGKVVAFGGDAFGQLGQGRAVISTTSVQARGLTDVDSISSTLHTVALKKDGTVWAWGKNNFGQVGDGSRTTASVPIQMPGVSGMQMVAAGMNHTVLQKSDGTVWEVGQNSSGQMGVPPGADVLSPIQVQGVNGAKRIAAGFEHTVALRNDGTVWTWGSNRNGQLGRSASNSCKGSPCSSQPAQVPGLTGVIEIAASWNHTLALKSDGTVWAWGGNSSGQLGDGTVTDRSAPVQVAGLAAVSAIAAGFAHAVALKSDGTVWAWGDNYMGELGDGSTTSRFTPVQTQGLTGVRGIAAGWAYSAAVKSDGALWVWGANTIGNLSDGTNNYRTSPVQVQEWTGLQGISVGGVTSVLKSDGTVWSWGFNGYGQLGNGGVASSSIPVAVPLLTGATKIAAGWAHSVALKSDGSVWESGTHIMSLLFADSDWGSSTPYQVPSLTGVTAIAAGDSHNLALKSDGSVWAWGWNGYGQLGDGTTSSRKTPAQVSGLSGVKAVAAGWYQSLALKSDGSVWGWGNNSADQLGAAAQQSCGLSFVAVATESCVTLPIQIAGISAAVALATGMDHSVALKSDGTVWTWGLNDSGQLGVGTKTSSSVPQQVTGLTGVTAIAAAWGYTLALKSDGTVWAWGANYAGQLGNGNDLDVSVPVQVQSLTGTVAIAAGDTHALAMKSDGTVWAWGWNDWGNLGDGTFVRHATPALATNETVDGPLDLIPAVANSIPPDKIPPFFSAAAINGSISNSKPTITNTTKFNPGDIGKSGAVFVTAMAPSGSLLAVKSPLNALGTSTQSANRAYRTAPSALTAANSFVLIQLTPTGWQQVVNGQLLPYASGVLGDQLAAQTLLSNTDTTDLKGAQFCLGYGTSADEMTAAGRMKTVVTIPDPNATSTGTVSCTVQRVNMRSYIPAANAGAGYAGYLRVINTGSTASPVSVALIDGATGTVGASGQLTASLPAGAAVTFTAQQVETALGAPLPAGDRPRIRVAALATTIEVQSFMSNPAKVVTQVSDALTADTGYAVRSYVPAANASSGYTSFIRVINLGTTASPIQATVIDDATGAAGVSGQLIASLPAGAAMTFTAQQIETALGANLNASSRPRISINSSSVPSVPLEVQSFMANPGGTVTQIGGAQSGTSVAVRSFLPAANAASGYTGFIRVINTGTSATPISVSLLDGTTGQASASAQLMASLAAGAAKTFTAQQVEAALGVTLAASARPRIQVTANVSIEVQSFMSNPGGTVTQLSGAQSGSSVDVRTYIPAANAAAGYASMIRIINTGTTATPVTVAVIDGATGAVGNAGQLIASLPAGAAVTYTAQQVETTLGASLPAGDRPRIRVTASASTIEVQSFMSNPGGVITETVDFQ